MYMNKDHIYEKLGSFFMVLLTLYNLQGQIVPPPPLYFHIFF